MAMTRAKASQVTAKLDATGSTVRGLDAKLAEFVSVKDFGAVGDGVVDDTAEVQAAVTHCFSTGDQLYWPEGTYLTTASISNFHAVRHVGPGVVQRGANLFYAAPVGSQQNTLFVSSSGSASNDGLSSSHPTTTQAAATALGNYGPVLNGNWHISVAAGTYARPQMFFPTGLTSRNNIYVYGPTTGDFRSTPTAIFDGQSTSGTCIASSFMSRLRIKDIKLLNWCNGTPAFNSGAFSGVGLDVSGNTFVTLENVHCEGCDAGWYFKNGVSYFAKGGVIDNCGAGVQELFNIVRDFKTAGETANRTTFQNCEYGLKAKELCTGHVDYAEFLDNTYGAHFSRACTGNFSNTIFRRNTVGVYGMAGSSFVDLGVTWGTGADINGVKFSLDASSMEIMRGGGENAQAALFLGKGGKLVGNDVTQLIHTGTVSDTAVALFNSTVVGDFQSVGEFYEGVAYGTCVLGSTASLRFRVGGNGASLITMPTGTYTWSLRWRFTSRGGDTQIAFAEFSTSASASVVAVNARAYAFSTTAFTLGLYVQLGSAGDTVTVEGAHLLTSEM
jgi:hypothetical protein